MKVELKTRLDTLISLHDEMRMNAISLEIEILVRDEDNKSQSVNPQIKDINLKEMATAVAQMDEFNKRCRMAGRLIKQELDRTAISRDN